MPFTVPTLETMTPSVDDVFKMVRSYDPARDGEWRDYLLNMTVYLVKDNLKHTLKYAIASELVSYKALYGSVEDSDDVEDYWAGFDEELAILFAPVIEHISQEAYDEILPGHDMSDAVTVWSICDELAEHISNNWPTITDTLTKVAGIDKIKVHIDDEGRVVVHIEGVPWTPAEVVPQRGLNAYSEAPSPPAEPKVVGMPKTPGAPPNLSAIQGQPNSQLLAEAFNLIRDKVTDTDLAEAGHMSRSTFLNYATGKTAVRLKVAQAAGLRHMLDARLDKIQRAINIFAQVTRDN